MLGFTLRSRTIVSVGEDRVGSGTFASQLTTDFRNSWSCWDACLGTGDQVGGVVECTTNFRSVSFFLELCMQGERESKTYSSTPYPTALSVPERMELAAAPSPASWGTGAAMTPLVKSRMADATFALKNIFDYLVDW